MTRHALTSSPRSAAATLPGRLAAVARTLWHAFQRERRLRATIRSLHGLNDRTLEDIGLRRADIEAAVRSRYHHE